MKLSSKWLNFMNFPVATWRLCNETQIQMFWVTQKTKRRKNTQFHIQTKKRRKITQFLLNVFEWNVTAAIELVFDQNCIFAFHCFSTGPSTALSSYVLSHFQLTKFCQISKSVSKTIPNIPNNNKTIDFFIAVIFTHWNFTICMMKLTNYR